MALKLTPSQEKLYAYIKSGRYVGLKQAAEEIGMAQSWVHNSLKFLIAHGLIDKQSPYRVRK